jgi:hypothetical protein
MAAGVGRRRAAGRGEREGGDKGRQEPVSPSARRRMRWYGSGVALHMLSYDVAPAQGRPAIDVVLGVEPFSTQPL